MGRGLLASYCSNVSNTTGGESWWRGQKQLGPVKVKRANQQAIQQALVQAQQQAAANAANTPLNQFLTNLESRVLAQVSQNLATAMFAPGASTSGSFNFQGNNIFWQNTGSSINLTVTDNLGNQTQINVPLGQFTFQQ